MLMLNTYFAPITSFVASLSEVLQDLKLVIVWSAHFFEFQCKTWRCLNSASIFQIKISLHAVHLPLKCLVAKKITSWNKFKFCHVYCYHILYNGHNSDHVAEMEIHQFLKQLIGTFHGAVWWYCKVGYFTSWWRD